MAEANAFHARSGWRTWPRELWRADSSALRSDTLNRCRGLILSSGPTFRFLSERTTMWGTPQTPGDLSTRLYGASSCARAQTTNAGVGCFAAPCRACWLWRHSGSEPLRAPFFFVVSALSLNLILSKSPGDRRVIISDNSRARVTRARDNRGARPSRLRRTGLGSHSHGSGGGKDFACGVADILFRRVGSRITQVDVNAVRLAFVSGCPEPLRK